MKQTKKSIHSEIWDNIIYGNYWGAVLAISLILLLYTFVQIGIPSFYLLMIIFFDLLSHILVLLTTYNLATPILKSLNFFKREFIPAFVGFPLFIFLSVKFLTNLDLPGSNIGVLIPYVILTLIIFFYFTSLIKIVSSQYSDLGFVYKPFLIGSIGGISYLFSVIIVIFVILKFPTPDQLTHLYYYIFSYAALSIITVIQFLRFVVEYPSAIQPKWKAYLPIDPQRIALAFTAFFLAVSLYFTALDLEFKISIPIWLYAGLLLIFIPLAAIFSYSKAFAGGTTLSYWSYLKTEMAAHTAMTLYVLTIAVMTWSTLVGRHKALFALFFVLSFAFYLTTAMDIRKLTKDLKLKVKLNPLTLLRYAIILVSSYFIIHVSVLVTRGRSTRIDYTLNEFPYFPIILIGLFFVFYYTYLKRSHKGFEELMKRGKITAVSYFSALFVVVVLFLLYLGLQEKGTFNQFPLFTMVFFGYFAVLIVDVYSGSTLRVKEYREKKDITDLLNHVAGHFFRTDVLEAEWDKVLERYQHLDPELERARFYAPDRTFDISMASEEAANTAATAMLLEMNRIAMEEEAVALPFDDDVHLEIKKLLGEKTLLLPPELSEKFEVDVYYPRLFETTLTRVNDAIKPFIPMEDYGKVIKNLVKIDVFFNDITLKENGVTIKEGLELNRKEFVEYLKLYIKALGETFPFNRMLLRDAVRSEIDNNLFQDGFTKAEILNVVSTGIKELDEVLYGGIIKGTSTLLQSEERRSKNDILFRFVVEGLKEKEPCIFATSRIASKDLLGLFKRAVEPGDKLELIDLFLSTHTENVVHIPLVKDNRKMISTSLIQVKQAVVEAVKKHPKEKHKRIVLDIYSDLAKYQKVEEIRELLIKQAEGLSRWNCTSIITLHHDLVTEETERHFDNVLSLTEVAKVRVKKFFGGAPKKDVFIIWGRYSPVEDPEYSLYFAEK